MSLGPGRQPFRIWPLLGAGLLAYACAGAPKALPPHRAPVGLALVREGRGLGPDLAVIRQPGAELVQLSLVIDAGARDADPPQVATLAGWLAAEMAGPSARAETLPDGIELSLPCPVRELAHCLSRLQRALDLRVVDARRLAAAKVRLEQLRRAADAADPGRAADRLALAALFGAEEAAGLFPLGSAQDDARAGQAEVTAFLARHFGPQRALLVGTGELDEDAFADAAAAAFARAKPASAAREERRARMQVEGGVAVDVADSGLLSLAIYAPTVAAAHAAALGFKKRFERDAAALKLRTEVRGQVLAIRGGALALLRVPAAAAPGAVRAAGHELEHQRRELGEPAAGTPAVQEQGGEPLARRLGAQWVALGPALAEPALGLGIGALVAGGRADRLAQSDPDAEQRERVQTELAAAFSAGAALGSPELHGPVSDDSASVTLDNGARIELRARTGDQVAIAVRFARGAGSDPPNLHGRAALLASLMASACAGLSPDGLAAELGALGAVLEPRVDAESFGLLLTAPSSRVGPALRLLLDCALHPGLERRYLTTARVRLLDRLGGKGGPGELKAVVADRLAPAGPGAVAPWGSPARQASVSLAAVRELFAQSAHGPAVSLAVVGAVALEEALAAAAPRLAELPAAPPATARPAPQADTLRLHTFPRQPTLGVALWRTVADGGEPPDGAGARAFAALLRAALSQVPTVTPIFHDGGVVDHAGWAAVGLTGPPDALDAAVKALPALVRALAASDVKLAVDRAWTIDERARAASTGSPASEAETLARAPFAGAPPPRDHERARALADQLWRSEPEWIPLR